MSISKPDLPHPAALSENILLASTHSTPHVQSVTKLCRPRLLCGMQFPTLVGHTPTPRSPSALAIISHLAHSNPSLPSDPVSTLQPEQHFKPTNLIISLIHLKSVNDFPWPLGKSSSSLVGATRSLSFSLSHGCVCACLRECAHA